MIERRKLGNAIVCKMDANSMGFGDHSFDYVLAGFIAWDYCYDFFTSSFTAPDVRSMEIRRVLREGGHLLISSWERQDDIHWLEGQFERYLPEYVPERDAGRPIVYSRETPAGYQEILQRAGFNDIQVIRERVDFVSPDENTWWQMMTNVGWWKLFETIEADDEGKLENFKAHVFRGLQEFKAPDGIHFEKRVYIMRARK